MYLQLQNLVAFCVHKVGCNSRSVKSGWLAGLLQRYHPSSRPPRTSPQFPVTNNVTATVDKVKEGKK